MKNPVYRQQILQERLEQERLERLEQEGRDGHAAHVAHVAHGAPRKEGGEVQWRRSSPPKEIAKQAATVAEAEAVDPERWLVGHSVSFKSAKTQGIDPLLNVVRPGACGECPSGD